MAEHPTVYSIGHSNHPIDRFLALLKGAEIAMVFDVRSSPASQRFPQFGKARLMQSLTDAGIDYTFAGDSLGGRPKNPDLWRNGRPDYARLIHTADADAALKKIRTAAPQRRVCLMCSEKDPLDCHRCLMIAPQLAAEGIHVQHILGDGTLEPHHPATEGRLLAWAKRRQPELFQNEAERLAAAYETRADRLWGAMTD